MGNYTPEQIERRANHFEKAGILDIAAMLRAYAATLRQQAGRVDEAGYVFLCSNPACRAVHIRDPHGPCHVCLAGNGGGWSTTRQRLYRNGPDRYSTEEEGEAYMEGWFDGQAALAQNTQGDGEAVAEVCKGAFGIHYIACADPQKLPAGTKLYLHAERARVPEAEHREWRSALTLAAETLEVEQEHMTEGGHDGDARRMKRAATVIRSMLAAVPSQRAEVK